MMSWCLSWLSPRAKIQDAVLRHLKAEKARINAQITQESSGLNRELQALAAILTASPPPEGPKDKAT